MITLLIVDDECITREGISNGQAWDKIGIHRVLQADDGTTGLETAILIQPDIVLTDVRMPYMDGIEMAKQIRVLSPKCRIIFMSGYSDKEYLLSAIQLKAISYIEKPIRDEELTNVLKLAVNEIEQEAYKKTIEISTKIKLNMSTALLKRKYAIQILNSPLKIEDMEAYKEIELLDTGYGFFYKTFIIKPFHENNSNDYQMSLILEKMMCDVEAALIAQGLKVVAGIKQGEFIVVHLSCHKEKARLINNNQLTDLLMMALNEDNMNKCFVAIGEKVESIEQLSTSYRTAVITLQKAFFHGYGKVIVYEEDKSLPYLFKEEQAEEFQTYCSQGDGYKAGLFIRRLTSEIRKYENTLDKYVKDVYYKLIQMIYKEAERKGNVNYLNNESKSLILESFAVLNTLDEIKEFLLTKAVEYFESIEDMQQSTGTIFKINAYIQKNYMRENLAIKEISEHNYLSVAYLCTYYKQETGKTINQYITEFRMVKARELLTSRKYKVSEISKLVGYSDSYYFAKIFKRTYGLLPTEYRERLENEE